jgi:cold shock CspA family protein
VQATVHRYDRQTGVGAVITDDGEVIGFDAQALAGSGLRQLRPGQRLTVELADPVAVSGSAASEPARRIAALRLGNLGQAPPPRV